MMKKLIGSAFALLLVAGIFAPQHDALAQTNRNTGMIYDTDHIDNVRDATGQEVSARRVVVTVINFALFFLGLLTTAMIIYGGFVYITAGGDDGATEKGKKILVFSAIGIVLILISFALVNTILTAADPGSTGDPTQVGFGAGGAPQ